MSIKCKIGDVVRVYRHHVKSMVGVIGVVKECYSLLIAVEVKGKGAFLFNRHDLSHVHKETTVIAGFHKKDMYNRDGQAKLRIGKEAIIVEEEDPCIDGHFSGYVDVPSLKSNDYYYAALLHTYNKGKK